MLHSLVLEKPYNIGVNSGRFMLNGEKTSIKEVSFVRYRFEEYTEDIAKYITEMQKKFEYSTHMVEVMLSERAEEYIRIIKSNFDNVPIYLYVPLTDKEIEDDNLDVSTEDILYDLVDNGVMEEIERVMIKDRTTSLYLVTANKFKEVLSEITGKEVYNIGICGSPLSFGEDACLSALIARDLIAYYGDPEKCKIPSANHQCMNSCGCIHYDPILSDVAAPIITKGGNGGGGKKKENNSEGTTKTKGPAKPKVSKAPMEWW